MTDNPWTDGRKAMLKFWWLHEQFTSTQIVELFAREGFHTTRNAVIGAVHRSDWWAGKSRPRMPPKPRATPEPARAKVIDKTIKKLKQAGVYDKLAGIRITSPPAKPVRYHHAPRYLAVTEVGYGECRFWFGEARDKASPKTQTGFCGRQVEEGSWCPEHRALVYVKSSSGSRAHSAPHKF